MLIILCFQVIPCIWGVALSFYRYDGINAAQWVGLDNYRRLSEDPRIVAALGVTLKYAAAAVPMSLALGFLIALALDE